MSNKLIVVGSINMDIVNHVSHHPRPGETVSGKGTTYIAGGKGANQAIAAARAGAIVQMVGAVGNDAYGSQLRTSLQKSGVHTDGVQTLGEKSGMAFITVDETGENTIILSPEANGLLSADALKSIHTQFTHDATYLLLQNEIPMKTNRYLLRIAQAAGVKVIYNPAPAAPVQSDVLSSLDLIILNESETQLITGLSVSTIAEAEIAAKQLIRSGPDEVIITLGAKGALYVNRDGTQLKVPAFEVDVVDTTAAGDTFIGAYAAARSQADRDLMSALQMAAAAAAICVTRSGAQPSIPSRAEILEFLSAQDRSL